MGGDGYHGTYVPPQRVERTITGPIAALHTKGLITFDQALALIENKSTIIQAGIITIYQIEAKQSTTDKGV